MKSGLMRIAVAALLVGAPAVAQGQGASPKSSIAGTVVSADERSVPDAVVTITNEANGVVIRTTSNAAGAFSAPSLDAGTYTVDVLRDGFKGVKVRGVKAMAGAPSNVRVVLLIGDRTEVVEVAATADLVQTQTNTIAVTLTADQIQRLPFLTRNVMYALLTLPGVDSNGSPRAALVNGLPQEAVNVTYDGVSVRDNFGLIGFDFSSLVEPTVDAVAEATVTAAVPEADSAGQGSVTVRFVTRAGTATPSGTTYGYFRHPAFNSRDFFRELDDQPKNHVTLLQAGASAGGPLSLRSGRDPRTFFFFNFEEFRQDLATVTRTRTVLNPSARQGLYRYNTLVGGVPTVQTVDLLRLGANAGQTGDPDPTIAALLGEIERATASTGALVPTTDLNTSRYVFQSDGDVFNHFVTSRVDHGLTPTERLTATYHWQQFNRVPDIQFLDDPTFPGLPVQGSYRATRQKAALQLRSVFGDRVVHELSGGFHRNPATQSAGISPDSFDNQQGFDLAFPLGATSATARNMQERRHAPNWNVDSLFSWLRGRHSLKFGGSLTEVRQTSEAGFIVPSVSFGVQDIVDPASALFTPQNFQGASGADVANARALYTFLTGRVTAITATAALDDSAERYAYNGPTRHDFRMTELGAFAQDQWQVTPSLTANVGLRWEVQLPVVPLIGSYSTATLADICGVSGEGPGIGGRGCNLFQSGTLTGSKPEFERLEAGTRRYRTDLDNFAPHAGIVWQPRVERGWLRAVLGDPETATLRAGASVAYVRNNMSGFQSVLALNPGRSTPASRNVANGNLVGPGQTWPLLLRDRSRLGPPATCTGSVAAGCLPTGPVFPIVSTSATNMSVYDPDIELASTRSFSLGLQRSVGANTAVELRYVGTRHMGAWVAENWNEIDFVTNGFLDEFQRAQANLLANMAANRGASFAYFGPETGTSPLPILLAHFNAQPASASSDPLRYAGASWSNPAITGLLNVLNPEPDGFFRLYLDAALRANGVAAGLPVNFWVLNPDVANGLVTRNGGNARYDAVVVDMRRRMADGLFFTINYSRARVETPVFQTLQRPYTLEKNPRGVPQAVKFTGNYELPFGRDRHFGRSAPGWLDALAGGWTTSVSGRVQSGQRLGLSGVRLVGMSADELRDAFEIRIDRDAKTVYTLPQNIIDNTIRAFSSNLQGYTRGAPVGRHLAPAGGPDCPALFPGDCGEPRRIYVNGPIFSRVNLSVRKRVVFPRRMSVDVAVDVFNVFDAVNFVPVFQASATATINQVTSSYTDLNNTYDPGGRVGQIAIRFNW